MKIFFLCVSFLFVLPEFGFSDSYKEREEIILNTDKFILQELSIDIIKKYEGFSENAYFDNGRCSIGFGTKAESCKEKIDYKTAESRLTEYIKPIIDEVMQDFPNLHKEGQSALVSFRYNCPRGYKDIKKNGIERHKYWCKKASGKILPGLERRRTEEAKLIFTK